MTDEVYSPGANVPPVDSARSVVEVVEAGRAIVVDVYARGGDVGIVASPGVDMETVAEVGSGIDVLLYLLDKLNSIAWGARNDEPQCVKLWDLVEISSSTPGSVGDSIPFYGTTSDQEIGGNTLIEHSFRDSGWIHFQVIAKFSDSRTGPGAITGNFSIQTRPMTETGVDADPATRGLPPTYDTNASFVTVPIQASSEIGYLSLDVVLHAAGHASAVWNQVYNCRFSYTIVPRATPRTDGVQSITDLIPVPIDTTIRNRIRMRFRAVALASLAVSGANWTEASKTITLVGAFAGWTPLAGEQLVITAGTGVRLGTYNILGKTSDDAIVLTTSIMATPPGPSDVVDNSIVGTITVQHLDVIASRATLFHPRDHSGY